jgi:hypothetical protein
MELNMIKHQRGYLLIVAIIAIVVIGFAAGIIVNMFITTNLATTNVLQSDQALYIAKAGLEITRRNLLKSGSTLACTNISDNNVYRYPPNCETTLEAPKCKWCFKVKGDETNVTRSLAGEIGATNTTINLNNVTDYLLPQGIVVIGQEAIWYPTKSGNQLLNVKRGILGTTAITHSSSSPVIQNICSLTATAGVPNLDNPAGKRIIKETLWKKTGGSGGGGVGSLPGNITPTLVAAGNVSLTGSSAVHNTSVIVGGPGFAKSTIVSGSLVQINPNASTRVGPLDTSKNPPTDKPASQPNNFLLDISQNETSINTSTLWGYFFTRTKSQIKNDPTTIKVDDCKNFDFQHATGTLWLTCNNFNPTGNYPIGTVSNPVTIIAEDNINATGNIIINGLLYVCQALSTNGSFKVNGIAVVEGAVNLNGSDDIYYDPNVLTALGLLGSQYDRYYATQEVFN